MRQEVTGGELWHSTPQQDCNSIEHRACLCLGRPCKQQLKTCILSGCVAPRSRVNLVGFSISFAWGRIWMTGHGVLASYRLRETHPWLSTAGTAFGVLFFAMNVGGGVLVWMREVAELRAQPQQTPFWMLENRAAFDDTVMASTLRQGEGSVENSTTRVTKESSIPGESNNSSGTKTNGRRTTRRRRISRSPSANSAAS